MNHLLRPAAPLLLTLLLTAPLHALDDDHRAAAEDAIAKGLAFLRSTQNPDGSWTPQPGPAVTGLVVTALLDAPPSLELIPRDDPTLTRAIQYILDKRQPDGSIRDGANGILANYNTAICLSALARLQLRDQPSRPDDGSFGVTEDLLNRDVGPKLTPRDSQVAADIAAAVAFLKRLQWQPGMTDPTGEPITEDHPFYGGAGYGNHGRPDLSNTQFLMQAFHDAGVAPDDEAVQRAVAFLEKVHNRPENNAYPADALNEDGGMIYASSIDKDHIGVPESKANPDEMKAAVEHGQPVSNLRSYGSMTYAGFKSYLYADLDRDDPRVRDALGWIRQNYALDRNPGMPHPLEQQGLYYYYLTHARALEAWDEPTLDTDSEGRVDWANNLIDAVVSRQRPDGSWSNDADRWMEGDPNLVTAYALLALQAALR